MKTISLLFIATVFTCHGATASWYGNECAGRLMANGKPFNPSAMTCASWYFPFGTRLSVSANGKSVVVVVSDRGPNKRLHRDIDLSAAAFAKIADPKKGLATVTILKLKTK